MVLIKINYDRLGNLKCQSCLKIKATWFGNWLICSSCGYQELY